MAKTLNPKASDCIFTAEKLEAGAAAEDGRVPIKMLARTSEPLNHFWWGRCVHDFASMSHEKSIPIDYEHGDPIGFLDTFAVTDKGLEVSGFLTPVTQLAKDAAELMKAGVPMQASINFAADKLGYEEVPEGNTASVNGKKLDGPLTIFRNWPLRGVALCRYGYDSKTKSELFSAGDREIDAVCLNQMEESDMSTEPKTTTGTPAPDAASLTQTATPPAATPAPAPATVQPANDPRAEFKAMVAEFGQAKAAEYFEAGISLADAKEKHYTELKAEKVELEKKVAELSKTPGTSAQQLPGVERNDDDASAKAKELQSKHGMSEGMAEFLAGTPIVGAPKQ